MSVQGCCSSEGVVEGVGLWRVLDYWEVLSVMMMRRLRCRTAPGETDCSRGMLMVVGLMMDVSHLIHVHNSLRVACRGWYLVVVFQ